MTDGLNRKVTWLYHWPDGWKAGRVNNFPIDLFYDAQSEWVMMDDQGRSGMEFHVMAADNSLPVWRRIEIRSLRGAPLDRVHMTTHQAHQIRKHLLPFIMDMMVPPSFDPFYGPVTRDTRQWFSVPLFVQDEVWDRMDNPRVEDRIKAMGKEARDLQLKLSMKNHTKTRREMLFLDGTEDFRGLVHSFIADAFGGEFFTHSRVDGDQRLESGLPNIVSIDSEDVQVGWELDGGLDPATRFYTLISMRVSPAEVVWDITHIDNAQFRWNIRSRDNTLLSLWNKLTWMNGAEMMASQIPWRTGGAPIDPKTRGWSVRRKSTEEEWWANNYIAGEPMYDDSVYIALGVTSPHLLPQAEFDRWTEAR